MQSDKLWNELRQKSLFTCKPFDRDFIWLPIEVFSTYQIYFTPEYNVLQTGTSYRSQHAWRHIHAVVKDEIVHCHLDTGNHIKNYAFIFAHFIFDVLPYTYYALKVRKNFKAIFALETYQPN